MQHDKSNLNIPHLIITGFTAVEHVDNSYFVEMGATESQEEVSRRRERGRRSQAAFRKRHAQSVQALSAQNKVLKRGIQRAMNAAHGDEPPDMLSALRDLAEAAELDIPATISHGSMSQTRGSLVSSTTTTPDLIIPEAFSGNSLLVGPSPTTHYRLDCSVWLDPLHYLRVSLPPQDILPYLGPGAESFAGLLFWSVMKHSQIGCAQHHRDTPTKIGLGHSNATKGIKPSFIETMAKARIEYKETGSISQAHAVAAEDDLGLVLCNLVEEDYRSRGKDPDQWLSCVSIEQRIRRQFGQSAIDGLREVALGHADTYSQYLLDDAQCKLYDNANESFLD
ncbi:hypothetical protein FHETE_2042 [Fusarium heterosporum]|uniref:BZIP domain-containing protein n=1 Tax=Fusarium heterosporum TaxID=42747 RepID=A0A8H5WYB0_FUSHE|nr:hypothetical protein FHETE_2042 [Fusarium heterosporum]